MHGKAEVQFSHSRLPSGYLCRLACLAGCSPVEACSR